MNVFLTRPGFAHGVKLPPDSETIQEIAEHIQEVREELFSFPSQETGLDIERLEQHKQSLGAEKADVLFLAPDDFVAATSVIYDAPKPYEHGEYLGVYGTVLVRRDPEIESRFGPGMTESFAIHEFAHASSSFDAIEIGEGDKAGPTIARAGFALPRRFADTGRGFFLEEGTAEYHRGQFIKYELGLPNGFLTIPDDDPYISPLDKYIMPSLENKDEMFVPISALGALSIEILAKHDPQILNDIKAARTSVDGLRKVSQRIDGVLPGMYSAMSNIDLNAPNARTLAEETAMKILNAVQSQ